MNIRTLHVVINPVANDVGLIVACPILEGILLSGLDSKYNMATLPVVQYAP